MNLERRQIQEKQPEEGQLIMAYGNILDDFGNFVDRGYGFIEYKDHPDTFKHAGHPFKDNPYYYMNHIDHYYLVPE